MQVADENIGYLLIIIWNKMKKYILLIICGLSLNSAAQISFTRVWERSDSLYQVTNSAENQKPGYFDNMNTRGIAFGTINSNSAGKVERIFLPSRHESGNVVRVLNAETGADEKSLDMTGVQGGGFTISDAGMTEDGVLLVSNCTHSSSGPFKVYKWTNEDAASTVEISFPSGAARYGDKIAVTGKYGDGSARIYTIAGAALSNYKVQYFGMEQVDGAWKFKQTPEELNTSITAASSNFHQFNPGPDGGFYFRSVGLNNFQQIKSDLTANIGNAHPTTIAQGSTVPVFIKTVGDYDYACYLRYGSHANYAKPAVNQVEVVKIDRLQGISSATVVAATPSFGKLAPGNGAGHVVVKHMPNGDVDVFVLSTQNGLARYKLSGAEIGSGIDPLKNDDIQVLVVEGEIRIVGIQQAEIRIYNSLGQLIAAYENTNKIAADHMRGVCIVKISDKGQLMKTQKILL